MGFELQYKLGGEELSFPLHEGEVFVGRKEYCDLCLIEAGVSKKHARFFYDGSRVEVFDAGSRNGTFLNGEQVDQAELIPGDVVQVGTVFLTLAQAAGASMRSTKGDFEDDEDWGNEKSTKSGSKSQAHSHSQLDILEGEEVAAGSSEKPAAVIRVFDGGNPRVFDCFLDKTVSIGGKEGNTIVLNGDGISRYHAEIYHDGASWICKDLGSRNGVYVLSAGMKEPLRVEAQVIDHADEIQIGTTRMRFELVKAEVDLSVFFKDKRTKPVLAGAVMFLIIVLLMLPNSRGQSSNTGGAKTSYGDALSQGVKLLKKKEHSKAEKIFERLHRDYKDQKAPKLFVEIAKEWPDQKNPLIFEWDKAHGFLTKLQKESDVLPKFVRLWVDTEAERVRLNKVAFEQIRDGQKSFEQGDAASRNNRVEAAVRAYDQAYRVLLQVSAKSEFYQRAAGQAKRLANKLYSIHVAEAQRYFNSGNSEWRDSILMYQRALVYTKDANAIRKIRRSISECQRNYEDETRHQRAVDIVQAKRWKKYKDALALLMSVSPKSQIYPDSKAYLEWIRADLKVRDAKVVYDKGDGARASQLMKEVLKVEVLGQKARNGVQLRLETWTRVIAAYDQGRKFFKNGTQDYSRARNFLTIVRRMEKNRSNYYRRDADKMLRTIRTVLVEGEMKIYHEACESLKEDRLSDAIYNLERLKKQYPRSKYLARVSKALPRFAKKKNWFKTAYKEVLLKRDLDRYFWARDVFKLLKDYLPANQKKARKESAENLKKIEDEIRILEKLAGDGNN